jgi:hypothetical protein
MHIVSENPVFKGFGVFWDFEKWFFEGFTVLGFSQIARVFGVFGHGTKGFGGFGGLGAFGDVGLHTFTLRTESCDRTNGVYCSWH